jgi:phage FluMu protein Com
MPITLNCTCGKMLRVADEYAGRRVKCPACNAITTAPAPEPEPVFEIEETIPKSPPAPHPTPPVAKPRVDDEEDYDGTTYGLSGGGGGSRHDEDDSPRDKPLPDFRLGSGQRGKKQKKSR